MDARSHPLAPEQVADQLSGPLLRYFRRLVGDGSFADDLRQEALLRVARGLPGFAAGASLKTWAFSIATRVAADHFRQPARRARVVEFDESVTIEDRELSVDERLVIDEMNGCVRDVIETLPDDYRAALVLHDLEGLSAAETAEICGCSLPTAKMRIHRARLRLKQALQRECDFYRDDANVLRCDRKP